MSLAARLVPALALLAAPVMAFAAGADDEVVATAKTTTSPTQAQAQAEAAPAPAAPAATRPLTTQEQIDAWLKASPVKTVDDSSGPLNLTRADEDGPTKRKIHGSVEVGVGTGGYRHMGVTAYYPVGETGTLGVAVSQTEYGKNGRGGYGYDGYGYGGYGYGGLGYGPYGYGRGGKSQSIALSLDMTGRGSAAERCASGLRADDGRYIEPLWATEMRGAQRPCDIDDRP
ncbi:hypothetical protein DMC25_06565 [Caulobacter sp. D4A]|uniref:hypothetical protein n=1 Tax=unclassified Caulobacter TaxID=2648921 RepID=UPI000D73844C|nr:MULTISPECIES: hypothetical protein [unclassified Caulobacter]PXA91210.1 hypothetical protein DMC25_06565 [Caulobacter sp. D4A]PXA96769.1 hypothetical protein DMC18_00455 [Caulobacter sp. D5]